MTAQHISSQLQTMNELILSDACAFISIVVSDSDIHSSLSSALAASVSMITFYTNTEYIFGVSHAFPFNRRASVECMKINKTASHELCAVSLSSFLYAPNE